MVSEITGKELVFGIVKMFIFAWLFMVVYFTLIWFGLQYI